MAIAGGFPDADIARVEKIVSKLSTNLSIPGSYASREILARLRRPAISLATYRELSHESDVSAEATFRLARHAYLLGLENESLEWINRIPKDDASMEWRAKGEYLRGVVFLGAKKTNEALTSFSTSLQLAGTTHIEIASAAHAALARLAFDRGEYQVAADHYAQVSKKSPLYEDNLEESAWAHVKLGRPELAATDIDLLFALYPESRRLPEAGYLFARLSQKSDGLERGIQVLEQLTDRFAFEEDSTRRALETYRGKEEELLAEIDPHLGEEPSRAILPPLGRNFLERNPTVRFYLGVLTEINRDIDEVREKRLLLEGLKRELDEPNAITIEGVFLLEQLNEIERKLVGETYETPTLIRQTEKALHDTEELQSNVEEINQSLLEVDRHIWINWKTLLGEREKEALQFKSDVRKRLAAGRKSMNELQALKDQLESFRLRIRSKVARQEESLLRLQRAKAPEKTDTFAHIDQLRATILAKEKARTASFSAAVPRLASTLSASESSLQKAREMLRRDSRDALRHVLVQSQKDMAIILGRFRWRLGEARYERLRSFDREMATVREEGSRETVSMEERLGSVETKQRNIPPIQTPDTKNEAVLERLKDATHFETAANEFQHGIDQEIQSRMELDRSRYERFGKIRETDIMDRRETEREKTALVYRELVDKYPAGPQTPYALYRLAQLNFEREQAVTQAFEGIDPKAKLPLYDRGRAIAPLERIQKEYRAFPYRDSALYLLGHAELAQGENRRSRETFEQLVLEFPKSSLVPEVELRIGEFYFAERQFTKAIPHYQAVLARGFNYFYDKALYKLAWANYLTGKYDSAIAHFLILLDYSEQLPPEKRKQFVDFAEEATEYVAFSMYRSGGRWSAENVFNKTGWKPYSMQVVKRMAEIQVDRGEKRDALASYDLAIERYSLSPELPEFLEARVKLLDEMNSSASLSEKARVIRLLGQDSPWRQKNGSDVHAIATADRLLERAQLSIAGQYEVAGKKTEAMEAYQRITKLYPGTRSDYDATFRRGEIFFSQMKYREAVSEYDSVVRNDKYGDHFSNALYNIVAAREKILTDRGGIDAALSKSNGDSENDVNQLVRAIDNFAKRAPADPRVPKAKYRSATILEKTGHHEEARAEFRSIAEKYPSSEWSSESLLAYVDTYVGEKKWNEASSAADDILSHHSELNHSMKSKLVELRESTAFKGAGALPDPKASSKAYMTFQKRFPESTLAPKALFNAFAVSKKNGDFETSQKALEELIAQYPKSTEAANGHFELAILLDATFEIDRASAEYRKAIDSNPSAENYETALFNLAALESVNPSGEERAKSMLSLASRLKSGERRAEIELRAAEIAEDQGDDQNALAIRRALASRTSAPELKRVEAASEAARMSWQKGENSKAQELENLATRLNRSLHKENQIAGRVAIASIKAARIAHERVHATSIALVSNTLSSLAASFKQKAAAVGGLEKSVVETLRLGSVRANASALYDLGLAYREFIVSLQKLRAPEDQKEEFTKAVADLIKPLQEKAKQALKSSYDQLAKNELPETYLSSLADEMIGAGLPPILPPKEPALWVENLLPDLRPMEPTHSSQQVWFPRGVVLLADASTTLTVNPQVAAEEVTKANLALHSIWSSSDRAKAMEGYRRALFAYPEYAAALYNLALLEAINGNASEANHLAGSIPSDLPIYSLRGRAIVALVGGKYKAAETLLETLLRENPDDEEGTILLVNVKMILKKTKEAMTLAHNNLRSHSRSVKALQALAYVYRGEGHNSIARLLLERAKTMAPDDLTVVRDLALALQHPRDMVLRSALLASAEQSTHPESIANRAKLLFDVRRYDDACRFFEVAAKSGGSYHPQIMKDLKLCEPLTRGAK